MTQGGFKKNRQQKTRTGKIKRDTEIIKFTRNFINKYRPALEALAKK